MKNTKTVFWKLTFFALTFWLAWPAANATANTYVILVAPKDSPAQAVAKEKANDASVFAERTLHRALTKAAELLNQPGSHEARVIVAKGRYDGKAAQGVWVIPQITNSQASLYVLGGFNDDFSGRQPFGNLTQLVTRQGRDGAILQIEGKSELNEFVISGFLLDAAPSNDYDAKTNSLKKATSRSYPLISFSMLRTNHLVVADNILLNGAHGAFDPYAAPLSANSTVDISNNIFLNNIKAIKAWALPHKGNTFKEINFRHNSFLLNWPFNPDPDSSNVSAVELYHNGGAQSVNFDNNLFAFNPGGAFQHDWKEDRMPKLAFRNNLFFMNAALFGDGASDRGVIAGKFGTNPKYLLLDLETVEDDFGYTMEGNVSFDPKIPLVMKPLKAVDSSSVQRQDTVINDVRRVFGMNQDGGTVAIKNYAPQVKYDTRVLPLPTEERAKAYGVQPNALWSFGEK
jgi:hypothetical protein